MATHIYLAELPNLKGITLRSTHFVYSPKIEFEDNNNLIGEMYGLMVSLVCNQASEQKCMNIKIYTPKEIDMTLWKVLLGFLNNDNNKEVIHQGRWTALVAK